MLIRYNFIIFGISLLISLALINASEIRRLHDPKNDEGKVVNL